MNRDASHRDVGAKDRLEELVMDLQGTDGEKVARTFLQDASILIQSEFKQHRGVEDASVTVRENTEGQPQLIAHIIPNAKTAFPVRHFVRLRAQGIFNDVQTAELPNGMMVAQHNQFETQSLFKEIFEKQVYWKHTLALPDTACIFDVGANIGLCSLFLSGVCRHPQIYAFEPGPAVYRILQVNAALYGLDAHLFNYALSREAATRIFTFYPFCSPMSGFFSDAEEGKETIKDMLFSEYLEGQQENFVPTEMFDQLLATALTNEQIPCRTETLSNVIEEQGIEVIDLLKIDAEKSELDILAGIKEEHWPKIGQIIMEVHGPQDFLQEIVQILEQHGYRLTIEKDSIFQRTGLYELYACRSGDAAPSEFPHKQEQTKLRYTPRWIWNDPAKLIADLQAVAEQRLEKSIPLEITLVERIP